MTNSLSHQASPLASNKASGTHLFPSPTSGVPNGMHVSSSHQGWQSQNQPYIASTSSDVASFSEFPKEGSFLWHSSNLEEVPYPGPFYHGEMETYMTSWCTNPLQEIFKSSKQVPDKTMQGESGRTFNSVESPEWTDQLISVGDSFGPNLSEVLGDADVQNEEREILQPSQDPQEEPKAAEDQPLPSWKQSPAATPSSIATRSKQRIRWTPELHEAFVKAVNQLGGSASARPKSVLNLMNNPTLTIYNVKSHLQKYRTARYKPETSEGPSEREMTSVEDMKTTSGIAKALKLQMDVQKCLYEQLETQKNLQLRIEEQGRHLLMMLEKEQKIPEGQSNSSSSSSSSSSSIPVDPSAPPILNQDHVIPKTYPRSSQKGKLPKTQKRDDFLPTVHGEPCSSSKKRAREA